MTSAFPPDILKRLVRVQQHWQTSLWRCGLTFAVGTPSGCRGLAAGTPGQHRLAAQRGTGSASPAAGPFDQPPTDATDDLCAFRRSVGQSTESERLGNRPEDGGRGPSGEPGASPPSESTQLLYLMTNPPPVRLALLLLRRSSCSTLSSCCFRASASCANLQPKTHAMEAFFGQTRF